MTSHTVVLLPQKTVVTVRKVKRLAQFLRARRYGGRPAIPWEVLPQADQDWWFREAVEHLVVAELVMEREQEVSMSTSVGAAAGILPSGMPAPRRGADDLSEVGVTVA